jgi:hydrogenase/urease accessory protein HupE
MKRWLLLLASILATLTFILPAAAHELNPAYLEIVQTASMKYRVVWKTPNLRGRSLAVEPLFPNGCVSNNHVAQRSNGTAVVRHWTLICDTPLAGSRIEFPGLDATLTDVLVRLQQEKGTIQTLRATPDSPTVILAIDATTWDVARNYFMLGVEHILSGVDHLLFVIALVLLITGFHRIVKTITAFTVAHSITLVATSLGWVRLPAAPVEAVIALSIVFLATELACMHTGTDRLAMRRPWIVAFSFGLVHGFGFAGALADIGLPSGEIPLALLTFNLGVEAGQILFLMGIVALLAILGRFFSRPRIGLFASYPIGIVASAWLFERVLN